MKYTLIILSLFALSCNNEKPITEEEMQLFCETLYEDLTGTYVIYSDTDSSDVTISFDVSTDGFQTSGISGQNFWFPSAPLSGQLHNCMSDSSDIMITTYTNIERSGLPSPGGQPRNYFESMSGHGKYFHESDSISLFINYQRTENFKVEFSGNLYLKKLP